MRSASIIHRVAAEPAPPPTRVIEYISICRFMYALQVVLHISGFVPFLHLFLSSCSYGRQDLEIVVQINIVVVMVRILIPIIILHRTSSHTSYTHTHLMAPKKPTLLQPQGI